MIRTGGQRTAGAADWKTPEEKKTHAKASVLKGAVRLSIPKPTSIGRLHQFSTWMAF